MARVILFIIPLAAIALGTLASAHGYIVRRLVYDVGMPVTFEPWLAGLVAVFGSTLLLQPAGERLLPHRKARWLAWPASLWMGVGFLLLVALGISELLYGLAGLDGVAAARLRAFVVLVVVGAASFAAVRNAMQPPRLARVEVEIEAWPAELDGFRIVQISDIHIGPILDRTFARELTRRVNALEPDLVAVTGDLVDGSVRFLEPEVAPFGGLDARHGVFFVTGNHDHYSDARSWVEHVQKLGMTVLRNTWQRIDVPSPDGRLASFALAGVDDHHARLVPGESGEDLDQALSGIPGDLSVVLLAHDPGTFKKAATRQIDLQISGHTHGGQIWPFNFVVRMAVPFVAGLYERAGRQLYVSRGTGFWGPPMRLRAPAELTEIVLRRRTPA